MDLAQLGQELAKIGLPLLGAALPIPGGAAIGTALASVINSPSAKPEDILTTLTANADSLQKAKEFELTHQETILKITTDAEIRSIEAVNSTMREESKADHWPTYMWRPFNGFLFGIMAFGCYFVLPLLHIPSPVIPTEVWLSFGGILGIASYFRGKMQADPNVPTDNRG